MKWIGQHIVDLIARFRNDVYLEDISTGTIASGGNLGLDSNNKIVKATEATGDITGVTAGTNLSGGGETGEVTINLADASTSVKGAARFSADNFADSSGTITIKDEGVDLTAEVTGVLPSANMDADTAHLSGLQTFTATKTFPGIIVDGNKSVDPDGDGAMIHIDAADITDGSTSASGTAAKYNHIKIESPRLMATNASVTTTDAASLYIQGGPIASGNQTITKSWPLFVDSGNVRFDGGIYNATEEIINSSGVIQVAAQTVIDHNQLANYDTGRHFVQSSITTVGTIGTGVWQGTAIAHAYIGADAIETDNIADAQVTVAKLHADAIQLAAESHADNDTSLMTSAAILNLIQSSTFLTPYHFIGYTIGDGSNYEHPQNLTDNQSPFEHATTSSADGLTIPAASGTNVSELMRFGGKLMATAGTLTKWIGIGTCTNNKDLTLGLFKWTPVDNTAGDITPVVLDEVVLEGKGNDKTRTFSTTSFTQASVAAGDIIFTQMKTESAGNVGYFNSTLEVLH